jgi:virulence-associated protein VapD
MEKYESIYKIEKTAIDYTHQLKIIKKNLEVIEKNIDEIRMYMIENDVRNIKVNNYLT